MNTYCALNYTCNHHCIFCPCGKNKSKREKSIIGLSDFQRIIHQICKNGNIKSITLSGGEPTLNPHFIDILKILSKTNLHVGILTNGDFYQRTETFNDIIKYSNPRQVHFTTAIHSQISSSHDNITQVRGSFNRSISNLQRLMQLGYQINIKHIIHKESVHNLLEYINEINKLFPLKNVGIILCGMDYCGMNDMAIKRFAVPFKVISQSLEEIFSNFQKHENRRLIITDLPICHIDPYYWKYFSYNGKKSLSAYFSPLLDNIDNSTINLKYESDCNTFSNKCTECIVKEICPGMWKSAYNIFGDEDIKPIIINNC